MSKTMIVRLLLVIVSIVVLAIAYFLLFKRDDTLRFLINSPLSLWATKKDQADPQIVWKQLQDHQNPESRLDEFSGDQFGPFWEQINLNGKGIVTHPPEVHASNAEIKNDSLVLSVLHDPDFENEDNQWHPGQAGPETYNNAFLIGFSGYSPTPTQDIRIEVQYAIDPDFHGSTGIWIEEKGTFDPQTGIMMKPFRSFGVSFLGPDSQTFLGATQLEAVVGFVPVCAKAVALTDISSDNIYTLIWSLVSEKTMRVELFVNGKGVQSCDFPIFYPGEIQLWADNYQVTDLNISRLNVPNGSVDQTIYKYLKVEVLNK